MSKEKPKICFVALKCYNLITQRDDIGIIGGAEVQQVLMARWLSQAGYDVSFVTFDHGQQKVENIDGVRVIKAYKPDAGLPIIRFFARWFHLHRAMSNVDADIYYQRGASAETGQVAIWCKRHNRKLIFGVAHELDCTGETAVLSNFREKILYMVGLKGAAQVITQTRKQQSLMFSSQGIKSSVLRNCGSPLSGDTSPKFNRDEILWVGRISPEKRFEWLLDLAELCPGYKFLVVGAANFKSEYETRLEARAHKIDNIEMIGPVPYWKMRDYYLRCFLLCSTSAHEGFPNVYLEAWQLGIPVLATYDPDNVIRDSHPGWIQDSVAGLAKVIKNIENDPSVWDRASSTALTYYQRNHTLDNNMPKFEEYIMATLGA